MIDGGGPRRPNTESASGLTRDGESGYIVDFGFAVTNRFVVVTTDYFASQAGPQPRNHGIKYGALSTPSFVEVIVFDQGSFPVGFTVAVF